MAKAKRTTARGKGRPTAYREITRNLVASMDGVNDNCRETRETLNLLGERVNVLDSRVTGEIEALRERLKAGEKRAEPIEYLQEKVQSLAELVRGNSAGSKVLLNDILDQQVRTRDCAFSKIEALEERLRVVEDRSDDATHGMFALSNRIRKVESDRGVAIAEAVLKIGELDSKLVQALERIEQLENAKPSPERTFKPTSKPNAEGPCVILAGAPWQGFRVYGAFINHEEAYLYQNKHLFREDFWWVLPLERHGDAQPTDPPPQGDSHG